MNLKSISDAQKNHYNKLATHIVQSWEWGEFRQKLGLPVLRYGLYDKDDLVAVFQLTLHKVPLMDKFIGYLPKGPAPNHHFIQALKQIGQDQNCLAIKIEPNTLKSEFKTSDLPADLSPATKTLFTKFNFILDLTRSEEEILKNMHPKTRYNIKVAQKNGVAVETRTDDEAFQIYQKLYFETTARQKYHGHNQTYHKLAWETLKAAGMARILIAFYTPPGTKERLPLNAWMLYSFKDTLYYPYGGSSDRYRNVMAANLTAWEAIKLGQQLKLKHFDLWGALPPDADPNHPWQGFNRFKSGYGAQLVEYIGSYDLVFDPVTFNLFNQVDKLTPLKVLLLKALKK